MGAIRRMEPRKNRTHQSSPYSRQNVTNKSPWSISGFLSYLNPLRSQPADSEVVSDESSEASAEEEGINVTPAESLSARGKQLASLNEANVHPNASAGPSYMASQVPPHTPATISFPPAFSNTPSRSPPKNSGVSPSKNLETVATYLTQKRSQGLNQIEYAGIMALLQESTTGEPSFLISHQTQTLNIHVEEEEKAEPFRFSMSPSATNRDTSPFNVFGSPNGSADNAQTPRKKLAKNPNGVYRWEGGGSARPRNRYRSPGFGTPKQPTPKFKLSSIPEPPRTDSKRRRVGEDAELSKSQRNPPTLSSTSIPVKNAAKAPTDTPDASSLFPFPVSQGSSPSTNGTSQPPKVNGAPLPVRPRLPPKGAAPAVPSPLRQAWGQSESFSSSSSSSSFPPQTAPKQTKAASFMTDLIKEVTPPKRPDVSNPYQTASPVKPPPRKPTTRRSRATAKPATPSAEKEREKEPEVALSPQAIIEATVPKGSKRSRPPSNLESFQLQTNGLTPRDIQPSTRRSPSQYTFELPTTNGINGKSRGQQSHSRVVEEISDEEEEDKRGHKRQKSLVNGFGLSHAPSPTPSSVRIEDIDAVNTDMESTAQGPAEVVEVLETSTSPTTSNFSFSNEKGKPTPPSSSSFFSAPSAPSIPQSGALQPPSYNVPNPKSSAPKEPSKLRFSYQAEASSVGSSSRSGSATPAPPTGSLGQPTLTSEASGSCDAKAEAMMTEVDKLPTYVFPISATSVDGFSAHSHSREEALALSSSSLPSFDFSPSAWKEPSTSSASGSSLKPTSEKVGSDWATAGAKPTTNTNADTSWTCSTCMLSNPASAVEKCTVCEAPKPGASKPAPTSGSFNWAAAGIKPPAKDVGATWTCGTCMLTNPPSATEKCTICDAPR